MVNKISDNIADYFFEINLINKEEKEIYIYGIKLIISSILGVLSIILTGIVLGKLIDSFIFLFCFMALRRYSGGYHAGSYLKCNASFIITFLIIETTVTLTSAYYTDVLSLIFFCISFLVLLKLSPIDNVNKKLNKTQKIKNRKISLLIFAALTAASALLKITVNSCYYNISVIVFAVSALMIIQKIKEEIQNGRIKNNDFKNRCGSN